MTATSNFPCPRCGAVVPTDATHCRGCGQHQLRDDPPEAWLGRVVDGKYEIESVVGVGGMGMVFAARRVLVGDEVALKVLFPRFLESPLQRRMFQDEAVAAARLAHSNVVTVFDAEVSPADGRAYIAMELLKGRTFKSVLRERAPMRPEEALPYMMEVCAGLEAAHAAQIIHRDLKPDNIFLERRRDGRERVKLVDFGIAAMLDVDPRDEQRKLLGTLRYMAPEQCAGGAVDARADLYALGVVLYECLTRRRATGKTVSAVLNDPVEPPNVVLPEDKHIPHDLEDLVMRLLAKEPEGRPPGAREVREEMARILERLQRPAAPVPSPEPRPLPAPPPARSALARRELLLGLALAGAAGLVGGVLWAIVSR